MDHVAIVAIVERGKADGVVKKAIEAGAPGATIFFGRGSGEHTFAFFRSLEIESSKEVIIIVTPRERKTPIYDAVVEAGHIHTPGKGIVFTFPVEDVDGLMKAAR